MRRAVTLLAAIAVATLLASGVAREIARRNNAEVGFVYRNALEDF